LKNQTLPQWSFITPNMTNDGHDTSVTQAGEWTRSFVEPLLDNEYFMNVGSRWAKRVVSWC
jgi:acid phosphatase